MTERAATSRSIWVVEINFGHPAEWMTTVGAGLSREDGRKELATWKRKNPGSTFRLRRYRSEK